MFKTLILAATAAAAITVATPASADRGYYATGNELLASCNAPAGSPEWASCVGYLVGSADQISQPYAPHADGSLHADRRRTEHQFICIPTGVTATQLALIVRKHLEANAKDLHLPAAALVWNALLEAYRCPQASVS
jgi:hypothetical protein